jgi:hypothetical protein
VTDAHCGCRTWLLYVLCCFWPVAFCPVDRRRIYVSSRGLRYHSTGQKLASSEGWCVRACWWAGLGCRYFLPPPLVSARPLWPGAAPATTPALQMFGAERELVGKRGRDRQQPSGVFFGVLLSLVAAWAAVHRCQVLAFFVVFFFAALILVVVHLSCEWSQWAAARCWGAAPTTARRTRRSPSRTCLLTQATPARASSIGGETTWRR